ncbi:hypothetical protein [Plantactinospora endophytica]|uniref:Flavin reductase n=1 Tax=Plantactinospora endophytica TaxID=673535 RepID=A0ABQ4E594_9ACTN|nr:hypothetical protein [Plantactinospora endophytica]GIG89873.1 hypothetical protein Pen02_48090 [Plantactinospora endophytica]
MIGPWARWDRHLTRRRRLQREIGQHLPGPAYGCLACEHDWPCPHARLSLLIGFDGNRVGLMMYLAAHLARALEALPDRHPAQIVGQIIYWVPRRRDQPAESPDPHPGPPFLPP